LITAAQFRALALSLPGAVEQAHQAHPDFRVGTRVFATLGYPDDGHGMVKLTPEQQAVVVGAEPAVFRPANGAWGRRGSTLVALGAADETTALSALRMAWGEMPAPTARTRRHRPARSKPGG
jgi:hypothetical protein